MSSSDIKLHSMYGRRCCNGVMVTQELPALGRRKAVETGQRARRGLHRASGAIRLQRTQLFVALQPEVCCLVTELHYSPNV